MALRAIESTDDDPGLGGPWAVVEAPERNSVPGEFPVPGRTVAWAKSVSADVNGDFSYIVRVAFGVEPNPNANGNYNRT